MSGKGDTPRPKAITEDAYAEAWERTFGDPREAMRRKHLAEAKAVIDAAPVPKSHTDA